MSMDLERIDLDTIQPNGKRGETQRPAFTKINQNFQQVGQAVNDIPGQLADAMVRTPARRNRLINGNFDIWQRGSSFSISGNYTADRWFLQKEASKMPCSGETRLLQVTTTSRSAPTRCQSARVATRMGQITSLSSSNVWRVSAASPVWKVPSRSWCSTRERLGERSLLNLPRRLAQVEAPRSGNRARSLRAGSGPEPHP